MAKILFLAHRIPFPPNKGDKIRAFHLLRRLTDEHEVWLGATVDDPADQDSVAGADHRCREVVAPMLGPWRRRFNMAAALLRGAPLSVARFRHPELEGWVKRVLEEVRPDLVFVYSSALAQYVVDGRRRDVRLVIDFVDADAAKWQAYGDTTPWPLSWVFQREARRLVAYEREVLDACARGLIVSEAERQVMAAFQPRGAGKLQVLTNGVDLQAFDATRPADGGSLIVMCGRMDYRANVDGAAWFAQAVLPAILARRPDALFRIVGAAPTAQVRALAQLPGVEVTGAVPTVQPHLAEAAVVVAPLRMARGIQNKVLEGMAASRPVVATSAALDGLAAKPGRDVLQADAADTFADAVLEVLEGRAPPDLAACGRRYVERRHSWETELEALSALVRRLAPESGEVAA